MSETRCRIRPTGWSDVVTAHVDDETWDARYTDPRTRFEWTFPCQTYEVIEVLDDEPTEPEPPVCTCTMAALWNTGCRCGAVEPYRVPR